MVYIYLSVYGIGSGHSIRCYRLSRELYKMGYDLVLSTFGDGKIVYSDPYRTRLFKKIFYTSDYEYGWTTKGLSWTATVARAATSLSILKNHLKDELSFLKSVNPSVVVSDSRISTIIASHMLDVPSILITNQLSIRSTMNIFNGLIGVTLPRIWRFSNVVVVQDLPPPYTITWSNIYPYLSLFNDKVHFIGLLEDYKSIDKPLSYDSRDIDILFYVSAPSRDRINFFKILYTYLFKKRSGLNYNIYIVEGNPKRKITRRLGNLTHIGWASDPYELMRRSKIIVLRGGQTSILESILLETPMIVMPAVNQTEQNENARRVNELGIGKYVDYLEFLENKDILWRHIRDIFDNYHQYIGNLKVIRDRLIRSGGIKKVVKLIGNIV